MQPYIEISFRNMDACLLKAPSNQAREAREENKGEPLDSKKKCNEAACQEDYS
jgi:hypothetical protein